MASALDWLQQQTAAPVATPEYDAFGGLVNSGQKLDPFTGQAASGANPDDVLYGSINSTGQAPAFKATLKQISDAAGMPGFDWTPYAAQAAQANLSQTGNLGYHFTSDWGQALNGIVGAAAAANPQIGQVWQSAGPQLTQQWSQTGARLNQEQQGRRETNKTNATIGMLSVLGAGLAAGAGAAGASAGGAEGAAAGAGAGAAGEAAALGGAASTPAMAAGAGGALGAVPSGLGAYYPAAAGGTAASEAAALGGAAATPTMAAGAGTGGAVGTGSTVAGSTALGRLMGLDQQGQDIASVAGAVLPSVLGLYGASQQTNAYKDLANQYASYGAPYRSQLADLYANPMGYLSSPEVTGAVQQGTDILARSLSTHGNPAGSGSALQELQNYATNQQLNRIGSEKDRLAGFGGLSAYSSAAPGAATNAIGSQANIYNAAGYGLGQVLNPQPTLADIFKNYSQAFGRIS